MDNLAGCQIPCLPKVAEGPAPMEPQPFSRRFKRTFARQWNYIIKKHFRTYITPFLQLIRGTPSEQYLDPTTISRDLPGEQLQEGDLVRIRSREEILATLDVWKELKGCAFLDDMWQYCDTDQTVLKRMERFLDERDYKVKKVKGLILLDGVMCQGTPVFGRCDRSCHFFWREEWLEKISNGGEDVSL